MMLLSDEALRQHDAMSMGAGDFGDKLEATLLGLLVVNTQARQEAGGQNINDDPLAGASDEEIQFEIDKEKDEEPPHDF